MSDFGIISFLICMYEAFITFMVFDSYGGISGMSKRSYAFGVVLMTSLVRIVNCFCYQMVLNLAFSVTAMGAVLMLYSKNIKRNLIISGFSVALLSIAEVVTIMFMHVFLAISYSQIIAVPQYTMMGTLMSKIVAFVAAKIVCMRKNDGHVNFMRPSYWIIIATLFGTNIAACYLIYIYQYMSPELASYDIVSAFCCIGLVYVGFFAVFLYDATIHRSYDEYERGISNSAKREYEQYMTEVIGSQKALRKLRHDLKNHDIALRSYFEKGECEKGIEYLEQFGEKLGGKAPDSAQTGNSVVDALINSKKRAAEEMDISFTYDICLPETLSIEVIDLCVLYGNALDNAVEACAKIVNGPKRIMMTAKYDNNSIVTKIENTIEPGTGSSLTTKKADRKNHGFGIGNIESALMRYKNIHRIAVKDDIFSLSVVIFEQ